MLAVRMAMATRQLQKYGDRSNVSLKSFNKALQCSMNRDLTEAALHYAVLTQYSTALCLY